jgi:hypothetical protein
MDDPARARHPFAMNVGVDAKGYQIGGPGLSVALSASVH